MATMKYNKNPIFLCEGKVFIDGKTVLDGIKCEIKFTPDVWTGKVLGEVTPSSRWKSATITGTITRRRTTPWLKEAVQKFLKTKETPEFTIQGIMDDKNSDYISSNGKIKVTCVGCVLTGDLTLLSLMSDSSDVLEDEVSFNAKNVIF